MMKRSLAIAVILAAFFATSAMAATEMSGKAATGASSAAGLDCRGAAKINLTAIDVQTTAGHDADDVFDGTVDIQYCPNTTACPDTSHGWQSAVTGITLGLTYTFHINGYYRFYVNYSSAGSVSGTIDSYDANNTRLK